MYLTWLKTTVIPIWCARKILILTVNGQTKHETGSIEALKHKHENDRISRRLWCILRIVIFAICYARCDLISPV